MHLGAHMFLANTMKPRCSESHVHCWNVGWVSSSLIVCLKGGKAVCVSVAAKPRSGQYMIAEVHGRGMVGFNWFVSLSHPTGGFHGEFPKTNAPGFTCV